MQTCLVHLIRVFAGARVLEGAEGVGGGAASDLPGGHAGGSGGGAGRVRGGCLGRKFPAIVRSWNGSGSGRRRSGRRRVPSSRSCSATGSRWRLCEPAACRAPHSGGRSASKPPADCRRRRLEPVESAVLGKSRRRSDRSRGTASSSDSPRTWKTLVPYRASLRSTRGAGRVSHTSHRLHLGTWSLRSGEVRGRAVGGDGTLRAGSGAFRPRRMKTNPGAPGSSLHGGASGAAEGAERRGRLGPGVPVSARRCTLRCDALEDGPRPRDRGGAPRVPFELPRLGAECSDAPREVCELALAHVNSDRVEAAYRRTDLFERRRELMEQWAAFLADQGRASAARCIGGRRSVSNPRLPAPLPGQRTGRSPSAAEQGLDGALFLRRKGLMNRTPWSTCPS